MFFSSQTLSGFIIGELSGAQSFPFWCICVFVVLQGIRISAARTVLSPYEGFKYFMGY